MDDIIKLLISTTLQGGPGAIVALLIVLIGLLLWDRRSLVQKIDQKDAKIEKIIEDYFKGTSTIAEALNGLKVVLAEIKGKL